MDVIRPTGSRVVYANAWLRVREDDIVRPDGSIGIYGVVDKPDFALVIPLAGDGPDARVHLVEQYRYPIARRCWELPQGGWAAEPLGDAEALARAELAEETGLTAASLRHLGRLQSAYGYSSQAFDVYLATGLTEGPHSREHSEQDMRQDSVPRAEFERRITAGEIADANSIAAWMLLRLWEERRPSRAEAAAQAVAVATSPSAAGPASSS